LEERAHCQVHAIFTYTSWLNQMVRRFELITQRPIRRGSFSSVQPKLSAKQ
jgi:hypothetical protein